MGLKLSRYSIDNPIMVSSKHEKTAIKLETKAPIFIQKDIVLAKPDANITNEKHQLPEWLGTILSVADFSTSIAGSIRAMISIMKHPDLVDLMKLDGITELPGALSSTLKWVGYGFIALDVLTNAYDKYQSGESWNRIVDNAIVRTGVSVASMYAAGLVGAKIGAVAGNLIPIPGVGMVVGAVVGFGVGYGVSWLATEVEVFGNTVEGHLTNVIDWITFWN